MGSSSAFTVGLLHAVHARSGRMPGREALALEAIDLEQNVLGERVGSQDQVAAAYGGLNHVVFHPSGRFTVRPITLTASRLADFRSHLMLVFTGVCRTAQQLARSYTERFDEVGHLVEGIQGLVERGVGLLASDRDLAELGELLHEAWRLKRDLSGEVSSPHIDRIYATARQAGALGGKLCGAGGGGFLLLFVPPERQPSVRRALRDFIEVPVDFDFGGSRVVFFDPGEDFEALDRQLEAKGPRFFEQAPSETDEGTPA